VTGGASGIGRSIALSLARRGARVIVADISGDGAETVARLIRSEGRHAIGVRNDVTADGCFETLRDCALAEFGRIDVVVNNVGVLTRGRPDHLPVEEWRRVLEINLFSVIRSNALFVPYFLGQGSGHIVNTASFAGLFTYAYDRLPYAASKAAIVQISEGLNLYLRPKGISVTLLCPGPVRTNISASVREFGPPTATRSPGDRFGRVDPDIVGEQIADAVLSDTFMVYTDDQVVETLVERASDWNGFMTRQVAELSAE